jgi:cation:H+ antiporter
MGIVGCAIAVFVPVAGVPRAGLWTGIAFSIAIFAAFLIINWLLVSNKDDEKEVTKTVEKEPLDTEKLPSLSNTIIVFVVTSIGVVFSALWLLEICDEMAVRPITLGGGSLVLGHSFVGSFLLALATSLPELFVSLGALKLGRVNMSIANIFGSNIMNMSFIPMMHLVSMNAGFYGEISPASLVMLFTAIIMSTLFIAGLMAKSRRSYLFLGWEAIAILIVYMSAAVMVFRMGSH